MDRQSYAVAYLVKCDRCQSFSVGRECFEYWKKGIPRIVPVSHPLQISTRGFKDENLQCLAFILGDSRGDRDRFSIPGPDRDGHGDCGDTDGYRAIGPAIGIHEPDFAPPGFWTHPIVRDRPGAIA